MRTTEYLTKYELARVIGLRILELSESTTFLETTPLKQAIRELRMKTNPMIVRRYLHDGTYEDRPVSELLIDDEFLNFQLCEDVP
jgi:DNA-directed RNA polymerase I, II, and III subunit RPABC2